MTALKAHEVERFVTRPDLTEGVILCYGPDAGLVRESAYKLSRRFAGDDIDGMNLIVLEGSELEADPARLALEARTTSLFGDRRVIRVRNVGKAVVMPLTAVIEDPAGAMIVLEAGNLPPKDALRALVEGAKWGRALPCYADSEETLGRVLSDTFSKAGIRVDTDTLATLRDLLGNDREVTRRELDKLLLFADESKVLTEADVLALCADNAALVLDEIVDATGGGNAAALDAALARALANAVNPQQILAASINHFSTLRRWRVEVETGKSPGAVLDGARPKPHFSRKSMLEKQLRLWSDEALSTALERLQATVSESRRHYGMQETLARRALLSLCVSAAHR
jgi:DNA polymerase III subunit delta